MLHSGLPYPEFMLSRIRSTAPLPKPVANLERHHFRWEHCTACPLCKLRHRTALFRRIGKSIIDDDYFRCDILLVGEAPGEIEDARGLPFVGPAGQKLVEIVKPVLKEYPKHVRPTVGLSNILACWPLPLENGKNRKPTKIEATACQPRLEELIVSVRPKLIVCVGHTAVSLFPRGYNRAAMVFPSVELITTIVHPAWILRQPTAKQPTETAICRLNLKTVVNSVFEGWVDK